MTFLFVNLAWVLFRAASLEEAGLFIHKLLSGGFAISGKLLEPMEKLIEVRLLARLGLGGLFEQYPFIPPAAILLLLLSGVFLMKNTQEKMAEDRYRLGRSLVTIILLIWCIISLSDVSEFLYFNF